MTTPNTESAKALEFYLLTPPSYLRLFPLEADRKYLSRPMPVELLYSGVFDRLLYVRDLRRNGNVFPVKPQHIRRRYQLTRRQRDLI